MNPRSHLILALDVKTFEEARALIDDLGDAIEIYKIGSQLFTACGPAVVQYVLAQGKQVFLDLKFHDIPNTVANAVTSAVAMSFVPKDDEALKGATGNGLLLCTLHTVGGKEMMAAAAAAATQEAEALGVRRPALLGITVLTSEANQDNIRALVLERAALAKAAGLDGVVASSQEALYIRKEFGDDFIIVTPGIRPQGADIGDQKRVTTPSEAIRNGSNYLVVGRPIVKAPDPRQAAEHILQEIQHA